jgi:ABC-type oligopeptide transport system ATPase subunit
VQAAVLNLLRDIQEDMGFACLFITHDLSTVEYFCDRVAVMFGGELVELGPTESLISSPLHPYTKTLLQAVEELAPPDPDRPTQDALTYQDRYDPTEESRSVRDTELREVAPGHYVAHPLSEQPAPNKPILEKEE